ncbi:MAG: LysE family transporter [Candidatus Omnitrophica bacterium]|nr:LysE family transporter [Candidatus Omnitrophota bacterium]
MIPGPLFLFTVSESLKKDAKVGFKIAFGHIIIEAVLIVFIFFGLKDFLQSPMFIRITSIVGAIALMAMGFILIRKTSKMSLATKEQVNFDYGVITGGAFFSAVSPGFIIWWATIGASLFVQALLSGLIGLIVLALGHWLADIAWHGFISYSVNKGKRYLSDLLYQRIMRLLALGLIAMGIFFLIQFFQMSLASRL